MPFFEQDPTPGLKAMLSFDPEFFNLFLLPPIIFEAGYSFRLYKRNIARILSLALLGTLVATALTWSGLYALGKAGAIVELNTTEAGQFAALISAVDPVATLSLFNSLKVDPTLNNVVVGESVLNDAVALIAFRSISYELMHQVSGHPACCGRLACSDTSCTLLLRSSPLDAQALPAGSEQRGWQRLPLLPLDVERLGAGGRGRGVALRPLHALARDGRARRAATHRGSPLLGVCLRLVCLRGDAAHVGHRRRHVLRVRVSELHLCEAAASVTLTSSLASLA